MQNMVLCRKLCKRVRDVLEATIIAEEEKEYGIDLTMISQRKKKLIARLEKEMQGAAKELALKKPPN